MHFSFTEHNSMYAYAAAVSEQPVIAYLNSAPCSNTHNWFDTQKHTLTPQKYQQQSVVQVAMASVRGWLNQRGLIRSVRCVHVCACAHFYQ